MHSFDLHSFYEFIKSHLLVFAKNSEINTLYNNYPIALAGTCCQGKIDKMNHVYDNIKQKLSEAEVAKIKEILGVKTVLFFKENKMFCEI